MGFVGKSPPHGTRWPNGIVPYVIDPKMPPEDVRELERALIEWMSKTQLNFVPRTNESNFIRFFIDPSLTGGCFSHIGMGGWGEQTIPCAHPPHKGWEGLAHEIGHAMGLLHEHQRPDRDNWITVPQPPPSGFEIEVGMPIGTYDCVSTMHYPPDDPTIKPKAGGCTERGSTTGLSAGDVATIAEWYGLPGPLLTAPRLTGAIAWTHGGLLHLCGRGQNRAYWHKSISSSGESDWTNLGGVFTSQPAAVGFGPDRFAVFGIDVYGAMLHKTWTEAGWEASWQTLGGVFHPALTSPPAVVSWEPYRIDVFGVGMGGGAWHKACEDGKWYPPGTEWQSLGGKFLSALTVTSWGPDRLDIYGIGVNRSAFAKAWDAGTWKPSETGWTSLGGKFNSCLTACSWGPGRLDLFGLRADNSMAHRYRPPSGGWHPADNWENLGGTFKSPPAACSWESGRLDVFGVGMNDALWHRARSSSGWSPSWEDIGGAFASRPAAIAYPPSDTCYVTAVGHEGAMHVQGRTSAGWFMNWKSAGGVFI